MSKSIKVGISVGDLSGIGIEVILKTLANKKLLKELTPIIYSSPLAVEWYAEELRTTPIDFFTCNDVNDIVHNEVNVVSLWDEEVNIQPGIPDAISGAKALISLEAATKDLCNGRIDVLVTAPIDKNNIQAKTFKFPGHTEYLAKKTNVDEALMLLVDGDLRVGVLSGHIPLKEVSQRVTKDAILKKLNQIDVSLKRDFGIANGKIGVLGLNPHAGDGGLIGQEELDIIIPAIETANVNGIKAYGPFPSDGLFGSDGYKKYDAILAMYHDQGLIPFKAIAFDAGVNFTAGLPIIRTSPDHGTAFDIAGKSEASPRSFKEAINLGVEIYKFRNWMSH